MNLEADVRICLRRLAEIDDRNMAPTDGKWFANEDYGWSCVVCGSLMPSSLVALGRHLRFHGVTNARSVSYAIDNFVSR